jgi:hypothetical protein
MALKALKRILIPTGDIVEIGDYIPETIEYTPEERSVIIADGLVEEEA